MTASFNTLSLITQGGLVDGTLVVNKLTSWSTIWLFDQERALVVAGDVNVTGATWPVRNNLGTTPPASINVNVLGNTTITTVDTVVGALNAASGAALTINVDAGNSQLVT